MSVVPENQRPDPYERFKEQAERFFEAQLERLNLGGAQIQTQDITALEDSLIRVDDALRSPESFGVLKMSVTQNAAIVLVKSNTEAHIQIGVVPILLERKSLIIRRLRELRSQRPITTLTELIDSIRDSGLRERLRTELEAASRAASTLGERKQVRNGCAFIAMAMDPNDPVLEDVLDAIKESASKSVVTAERIDEARDNFRGHNTNFSGAQAFPDSNKARSSYPSPFPSYLKPGPEKGNKSNIPARID